MARWRFSCWNVESRCLSAADGRHQWIYSHLNAAYDLLTEGICKEIHIHFCSHVPECLYMITFWWSAHSDRGRWMTLVAEFTPCTRSFICWQLFFFSIYLSEKQPPFGPHTLSIRLDYHSSSSHIISPLIYSYLFFVPTALSVSTQSYLPSPCSLRLLLHSLNSYVDCCLQT